MAYVADLEYKKYSLGMKQQLGIAAVVMESLDIISSNYVRYLKNNLAFTHYNYFCKLQDWSNENEYRFVACGDAELFVHNISTAIVGVIIGEQIKPSDVKIVKLFVDDRFEIKQISFSYNGCLLTNIYTD